METAKIIKEVAMVSAIMSDAILKELHKELQDFHQQGYIGAIVTISDWAAEFEKKHRETNWEDVLMNNSLKPLSEHLAKHEIICWDDAVMDFAHFKFEQFKK